MINKIEKVIKMHTNSDEVFDICQITPTLWSGISKNKEGKKEKTLVTAKKKPNGLYVFECHQENDPKDHGDV